MKTMNYKREFSSFRDSSGCIFTQDGTLYRRINPGYFPQYRALMQELYGELVKFNALIPHEEIKSDDNEIVILPEKIPFISYPYEWSFSELKDAALLTLKLHRRALNHD